MFGVFHQDHYAVEETFQILKVPWEWYDPEKKYDVLVARKKDVPEYPGNLIDLTDDDIFQNIRVLLNEGQNHLHEPLCDIALDRFRQKLKKYTPLVEIPPSPWGHPYMMALTHDVDVTSVRECRFTTVGYAAFQCFLQGNLRAGLRILLAKCGFGKDPWVLFEKWKSFEDLLNVKSSFYFVPFKEVSGMSSHAYRAVHYDIDRNVIHDLVNDGWEVGVHGIDNWIDADQGKYEIDRIGIAGAGNRTHWLSFNRKSWQMLESAGYSYDTTFGYNDDIGFRAGTLQVYRPDGVTTILEMPLHIQDVGLLGKYCWTQIEDTWVKTPCLYLNEISARDPCDRLFDFAKKYGGVITILWHYENLTSPRNWSGLYSYLVNRGKDDGAWITKAGDVVDWFKDRRQTKIKVSVIDKTINIYIETGEFNRNPPKKIRIHRDPSSISHIDGEYIAGDGYIDIKCDRPEITVILQ